MKSLPKFLPARVGRYRPQGESHVRITAQYCVDEFDIKMLRNAEPKHGRVLHKPTGKQREALFTALKIGKRLMYAERVTGTLYNESGVSSSPDIVAEFA